MDTTTSETADRSRRQGGPPLGVLALVSTALPVAALAASAALGGTFPSPYADPSATAAHFAGQPDTVLAGGVLVFGSAIPLVVYAATASARLRQLGVTTPGATIALARFPGQVWLVVAGFLLPHHRGRRVER